jgi:hypothetical protein
MFKVELDVSLDNRLFHVMENECPSNRPFYLRLEVYVETIFGSTCDEEF